MKYYFSENNYSSLLSYSKATQLKYLKEYSESDLQRVKRKLELNFNLSRLEVAWVSRSTFGNVFVDYQPEKTGPSIIGAHKRLFDLICDDIKYVILSKKISRNFLIKQIEGFKVLIINIDSYKIFITKFGNQEQRIRLFLFRQLSSEEERIINNWLEVRPSIQENLQISNEDLLDHLSSLKINSVSDFNFFLERLNAVIKSKVTENIQLYQEKLDEFKKMINDDSVIEVKLSKFLHENAWILDFKYLEKNLDLLENEYSTDVGNVDIYISKEQFGITRDVVIELKASKKGAIKKYRNKPAITAEVGNAISQLINYMETQKDSYKVTSGLVILGRKKNGFLDLFNEHLSKINIITYEEIATNCQDVLDAFRSGIAS